MKGLVNTNAHRRTDGLPQFNEWFEDYGMNKVTHVMELWAAGYGNALF